MYTQYYKKPSELVTFTLNVLSQSIEFILNMDIESLSNETVISINSISAAPFGLTIDSYHIDPTQKSVVTVIEGGIENTEYLLTVTVTTNLGRTVVSRFVIVALTDNTQMNFQYYGNTFEGDDYFKSRLNSTDWIDSTVADKRRSLVEATRLIDRLNFVGRKADPYQSLQFPRFPIVNPSLQEVMNTEGLTIVPLPSCILPQPEVPIQIRFATYELSLDLLEGVDPDMEVNSLYDRMVASSGIRISRKEQWVPEYIQAGISSARAWYLLKPFLRDYKTLQIQRIT